jgi:putative ATP-dependent endonuclease of OLD family
MKLHAFKIQGFKRLKSIELLLGDATFLIGSNNAGKSSALKALQYFLSGAPTIPSDEYYSEKDEETGFNIPVATSIILEGEFRNLPVEAHEWVGFKGRIFNYNIPAGSSESGLSVFYRKTYDIGSKIKIEIKSRNRSLKECYSTCKTPQDFIDMGCDENSFDQLFDDKNQKLTAKLRENLELINDLWDTGEEENWVENPGGIQGTSFYFNPCRFRR